MRHRRLRTGLAALAAATMAATAMVAADAATPGRDVDLAWGEVSTPTSGSIRALDVVSADVVWAASDFGEVVRTTDGGATWDAVAPDVQGLAYRDIEATDQDHAVLLSIGTGSDARVFVTDDGGATWTETWRNPEDEAFYNCIAFWTPEHGIMTGDPIDGTFRVQTTDDGGATWTPVPDEALPPADGEFGFSASGTCVTVAGGTHAWFATGGADARVFVTDDRGASFAAVDTPLPASDAGGVFTIAMRTPRHGVILGGDFLDEDAAADVAASTSDGGATWDPAGDPTGYRSGSAWVTGLGHTAVAVGPNGSDVSVDGGATWTRFSDTGWHAVECSRTGDCLAAGSGGRVAPLHITR